MMFLNYTVTDGLSVDSFKKPSCSHVFFETVTECFSDSWKTDVCCDVTVNHLNLMCFSEQFNNYSNLNATPEAMESIYKLLLEEFGNKK